MTREKRLDALYWDVRWEAKKHVMKKGKNPTVFEVIAMLNKKLNTKKWSVLEATNEERGEIVKDVCTDCFNDDSESTKETIYSYFGC
ncbi:MAG: hypothetical protein LBG21_03270 [Campylobacteraceae bacterium]|jgi:hypothetical protein|nr:hypothetical protein [Campylobacteraceae bacterium]